MYSLLVDTGAIGAAVPSVNRDSSDTHFLYSFPTPPLAATAARTKVARVRAEYPSQLDDVKCNDTYLAKSRNAEHCSH